MGALDYLSHLCTATSTSTSTRRKRKVMQTVEIKVKMDCDGCERKVKNAVTNMKGVKTVEIDRKQSRIKVSGYIEPNRVLKKVKNTGKRAEFWPYIPQHLVNYPMLSQAYDKRAPAGHVKNVIQTANANANDSEEKLATMFSDDNTNACSIM